MADLLAKLTGGRPMRCDGRAFPDQVSGNMVYEWTDLMGRRWLAEGAWSLFRVSIAQQQAQGGSHD